MTLGTDTSQAIFGPANSAGQGYQWAQAIGRHVDGFTAANYTVVTDSTYAFPTDRAVHVKDYVESEDWSRKFRESILSEYSFGFWESGRPPLGTTPAQDIWQQIEDLRVGGIRPAFVGHGSDVRIPSLHAERYAWSPFRNRRHALTKALEIKTQRLHQGLAEFDGPKFVSTPDLLEVVPGSRWLPVIVAEEWFTGPAEPRSGMLRVAHITSNSMIKRSDDIDLLVEPFVQARQIDYRRISGLRPDEVRIALAECDVVLDQFGIGSYGVAACEAMALGCTVVGNVTQPVRAFVKELTGHHLPIMQAELGQIPQTLELLVTQPEQLEVARQVGPAFVRAVHDGTLSASVMGTWLNSAESHF